MSKSKLSDKDKLLVWVKAGGRCEYPDCAELLWRDDLTYAEMNRAYLAHIIGERGARADPELSEKLAKDPSNFMLLCDTHHRLIDIEDEEGHPADLLFRYKQEHEERIERQTSIQANRKTHIVLFGSRIGDRSGHVNFQQAREALLAEGRYPATDRGIRIDLSDIPVQESDPSYWKLTKQYIDRAVDRYFQEGFGPTGKPLNHLSLFALAPIPALVYFGKSLGDIVSADVYQRHRTPSNWMWREFLDDTFNYTTVIPEQTGELDEVAIALSLSGRIHDVEIEQALGNKPPTYVLTTASPSRTYLTSKEQLELFRNEWRSLLSRIRGAHGPSCEVRLFPAVPNSVAVEIGRLLLPKADPPLHIYDYDRTNGGFRHALTV